MYVGAYVCMYACIIVHIYMHNYIHTCIRTCAQNAHTVGEVLVARPGMIHGCKLSEQ